MKGRLNRAAFFLATLLLFAIFRKIKIHFTENCKSNRVQFLNIADYMKVSIRFVITMMLVGLFSSCAEQFREIRGSEHRGNPFGGGQSQSKKSPTKSELLQSTTSVYDETPKYAPIQMRCDTISICNTTAISKVTSKTNRIQNQSDLGEKSAPTKVISILPSLKKGWNKYVINPNKKQDKAGSNKSKGNIYMTLLGIFGLIGSIFLFLFSSIYALLEEASLILAVFGLEGPFLLDLIVIIMGFASSIWIISNPPEDMSNLNALQILAIIFSALNSLLPLILLLGLIYLDI